ncbi:MAG: hypothetical protein JW395_0027 [Nitrospira sp.]|nr:hypothetical protein [Nitrospira sp.]
MVQHFQRDGLKLVIAAVRIEQIVRHHGVQIGANEGQPNTVKHQQGRLQVMDNFCSRGIMQQRNDGAHIGVNIEWNEGSLVPRGECYSQ